MVERSILLTAASAIRRAKIASSVRFDRQEPQLGEATVWLDEELRTGTYSVDLVTGRLVVRWMLKGFNELELHARKVDLDITLARALSAHGIVPAGLDVQVSDDGKSAIVTREYEIGYARYIDRSEDVATQVVE